MTKWVVELALYGVNYEPKRAIKDKVLADFIAECSIPDAPTVGSDIT